MRILIVLPTYKELPNLKVLLPRIFKLQSDYPIFVYLIDDNSNDGTKEFIASIQKNQPIDILHRPKKLGLGTAYLAGFSYAQNNHYNVAITMDSDLSHQPENIFDLTKIIEGGADVAIGSRYVKGGEIVGWPCGRRFLSWGANRLSRSLLGLEIKDCTSGFRAYNQKAYQFLLEKNFHSHGYALLEEMLFSLAQKGFIIKETPICFTERLCGQSKISKKEILKGALMLARYSCLKLKNISKNENI